MTFRKCLAVLLFVAIPSPVLADGALSADRDPLRLEAQTEARAGVIAQRAANAALARPERALQSRVDRKISDRLAVALVPPVRPWQLGARSSELVAQNAR
jgi:hypothetical protein